MRNEKPKWTAGPESYTGSTPILDEAGTVIARMTVGGRKHVDLLIAAPEMAELLASIAARGCQSKYCGRGLGPCCECEARALVARINQ